MFLFSNEKKRGDFAVVFSSVMITLYPLSSTAFIISALLIVFTSCLTIMEDVEKLTRTSCTPSHLETFFCNFKAQSGQSSPSSVNEEVVISNIQDVFDEIIKVVEASGKTFNRLLFDNQQAKIARYLQIVFYAF